MMITTAEAIEAMHGFSEAAKKLGGVFSYALLPIVKERTRRSYKREFPKELLKCEICGCRVPALYPWNGSVLAYCSKHIYCAPVGSRVYMNEAYGCLVALHGEGESILIMDFDMLMGMKAG